MLACALALSKLIAAANCRTLTAVKRTGQIMRSPTIGFGLVAAELCRLRLARQRPDKNERKRLNYLTARACRRSPAPVTSFRCLPANPFRYVVARFENAVKLRFGQIVSCDNINSSDTTSTTTNTTAPTNNNNNNNTSST